MATHTLPNYEHRITSGLAKTKEQSRARNDRYANSIYAKRLRIDAHNDDKRLRQQLGEMEL